IDPCHPQWFEIQQMAGMFLGRPLVYFAWFPGHEVASSAADNFFKPGRRASQALAKIRMLLHWKREVKLSFEPEWWIHGCTEIMSLVQDAKAGARDAIRGGV